MNWYRRHRDGRLYWVIIAWVVVELIIGYGMVFGFWWTGVSR